MGPQEMAFEYAPGLKHPGDDNCDDLEEKINCYCDMGYVVD